MNGLKRKFVLGDIPYDMELYPKKSIEIGYISSNPLIGVRSESNQFYEECYLDFDNGEIETEKSLPSLNFDFFINNALIPETNLIEKEKYYFSYKDVPSSSIYIYNGKLTGLKVIEIEFEDEEQFKSFVVPFWFKQELDSNINDLALSYFNGEDLKSFILTK